MTVDCDDAANGVSGRWVRPPRLATGEDRDASRLELFYDLAYVLVVAELASAFAKDLSWSGAATFAGLFTAMWVAWVSTTLYANRFDTDDVVFRLAQLVGTAAIAGCAAAATGAIDTTSVPFAACFLLGRLVLLGLYLAHGDTSREPQHYHRLPRQRHDRGARCGPCRSSCPSPADISCGRSPSSSTRGPVLATWRGDTAPLHMEHLPERFGLFVILVLGEMVAGVVTGIHGAAWVGESVTVGGIGFLIAASLWWSYFDVASARGSRELQHEDEETDERHDLYIYGHLPLTLGIAAAGIGLEELVLHPNNDLPTAGGWTAISGVALCLIGAGIVLAGAHHRLSALWPWPTAALPPLAAYSRPARLAARPRRPARPYHRRRCDHGSPPGRRRLTGTPSCA